MVTHVGLINVKLKFYIALDDLKVRISFAVSDWKFGSGLRKKKQEIMMITTRKRKEGVKDQASGCNLLNFQKKLAIVLK